ncbi:MAG: thioredoxin domain-containing protein [Kofleriaceae bacterium]|nr:thioredoxin domain-containing protein [Kofleriaceae bacterium]
MRWMAAVCLVGAACGGANSGQVTTLEQRVTALETKPAETPPRDSALEARVRDLETQLAALQEQLALAKSTPPPAPTPPPRRGILDAGKVYAVPIDDSPATGAADAPVTIVAAVQFPEPYTHRAWPVLKELRKQYKKDLRLVFKSFIVHPKAANSSIAACAAARQSALDKMEDAIYAAAEAPPPNGPPAGLRELDEIELREIARALRLNLAQYDHDLAGCKAGQTRDIAMFSKLGQNAVPVFWINGRPLSGAQQIESFRKIIDEELEKAKQDRTRGGKASDYYDRITANGATTP